MMTDTPIEAALADDIANESLNNNILHQQVFCAALEVAINKTLAMNINGSDALDNLDQQTLTMLLAELNFPLSFSVDSSSGDSKVLVSQLTTRSLCRIETSIKTLLEIKQSSQQLTELIKQGQLDIHGDIKIAQNFALLAETIDIDWQTELAKHIGDVATYKLSKFGNKILTKLGFATKQIQADASEWLVHEKRLVVTKSQVSNFNQQVDALSEQADSLSLRIKNLSALL